MSPHKQDLLTQPFPFELMVCLNVVPQTIQDPLKTVLILELRVNSVYCAYYYLHIIVVPSALLTGIVCKLLNLVSIGLVVPMLLQSNSNPNLTLSPHHLKFYIKFGKYF